MRFLLLVVPISVAYFPGDDGTTSTTQDNNAKSSQEELESALSGHVSQSDVNNGIWTTSQLREAGRRIFAANFTVHDGAGRPGATGSKIPRRRSQKGFTRFSKTIGNDANSCQSCHNTPSSGGAGDFITNVFVGLGDQDPPLKQPSNAVSNQRGTPELNGTGIVELVAREISFELQSIRDNAKKLARTTGVPVQRQLTSKSINFGSIIAMPNGDLDVSKIDGIDHDLVIRPFGHKGTVASLREFTVDAANLHHGMQAEERFGAKVTGIRDFDADGVAEELTTGDITALTIFQATLNMPGQVLPSNPREKRLVGNGARLFNEIGCSECHTPFVTLRSSLFEEPGPFNLRGTLKNTDVVNPVKVDLSTDSPSPRLVRSDNGTFKVWLYSDFKRHQISDHDTNHWGNEIATQRAIPTNVFLTRRLWAVGSTAPYGHRGDLTTIQEAIKCHGGEARDSRIKYETLSQSNRRAIIRFLQSLRILPDGSKNVVIESPKAELPYQKRKER